MGKGHCKIDITDLESEFRDFYDFEVDPGANDASDNSDGSEMGETDNVRPRQDAVPFARVDDKTLRLGSGRILTHRSDAKARPFRRKLADSHPALPKHAVEEERAEASPSTPVSQDTHEVRSTRALARSAEQELVFEKQLASLRAGDRRSLAHLTAPELRTLLRRAIPRCVGG